MFDFSKKEANSTITILNRFEELKLNISESVTDRFLEYHFYYKEKFLMIYDSCNTLNLYDITSLEKPEILTKYALASLSSDVDIIYAGYQEAMDRVVVVTFGNEVHRTK